MFSKISERFQYAFPKNALPLKVYFLKAKIFVHHRTKKTISRIYISPHFILLKYLFVHVLSHFSLVWPFVTLWTIARQALLSMRFSTPEHRSWLSCPPPGALPTPGVKPSSAAAPALHAGSWLLILLRSPSVCVCVLTNVYVYTYIHTTIHIY